MLSSKQKFYLLVMAMGFLGACCRYALELAFYNPDGLPFGTLIINIAGCFVMEIVNLYLVRRTHAPAELTKAIGTGFVGAFTTLSAVSTEMLTFLLGGRYGLAALYVSLTLVTTVLASLTGKGCVALMLSHKMRVLQARREQASALRREKASSPAHEQASTLSRKQASIQGCDQTSTLDREPAPTTPGAIAIEGGET